MKTIIKIQLLLLFMSTWSMAQVTVTLRNVSFDTGTPTISNCGEIDLGTRSSAGFTGEVYLEKPDSQVVGESTLFIYHKNSVTNNLSPLHSETIIESSWAGTNPATNGATVSFTLYASSVNVTGDKVFAVFKSSSNVEYSSCEYSVKKTPTPSFSLYPISTSFPCATTTPKTFRVTAQNAPGATYQWNVGTGWATGAGIPVSGIITTSNNELTLVPHSYPYSNIRVTPVFDRSTYPTMTCQITIDPFYSTARIIGNGSICSGSSTYIMDNLQSNETVTWSISDPTLATISSATGNQVILTKMGNGTVELTGIVSNSCNQTNTKVLTIGLGVPTITKPNCPGGFGIITPIGQLPLDNSQCDLCRSYYFYTDKNMIEAEATGGHNLTWQWEQLSNNFLWTTHQHRARFMPNRLGVIEFRVRASNACGWSAWREQQITISEDCVDDNDPSFRMAESSNFETTTADDFFSVYPNPTSSIVYLELENRAYMPHKKAVISAELFDFYGFSKGSVKVNDHKAQFNVSKLPRGTYVLKISIDGKRESHQIVVE